MTQTNETKSIELLTDIVSSFGFACFDNFTSDGSMETQARVARARIALDKLALFGSGWVSARNMQPDIDYGVSAGIYSGQDVVKAKVKYTRL